MATVYHKGQAGAPVLPTSYTSGPTTSLALIKTILVACLVVGYAGKPPAGWELIADGPTYIVLRNGTHSGYLCLTVSGPYLDVYLSETYTGVVDGVITGDGARSGSGGVKQNFAPEYMAYPGGNSSWFLLADSSTFILCVTGNHTDETLSRFFSGRQAINLYAGEDKSGNFLSFGGKLVREQGDIFTGLSQLGHTVLKDPVTGFLLGAEASLGVATPELALGAVPVTTFSDAVVTVGDVFLCPSTWVAGGRLALLKGLVHIPALMLSSPAAMAKSLGFSGNLTLANIHTPLNLGDAFQYFVPPRPCSSVVGMHLVTDNPGFW